MAVARMAGPRMAGPVKSKHRFAGGEGHGWPSQKGLPHASGPPAADTLTPSSLRGHAATGHPWPNAALGFGILRRPTSCIHAVVAASCRSTHCATIALGLLKGALSRRGWMGRVNGVLALDCFVGRVQPAGLDTRVSPALHGYQLQAGELHGTCAQQLKVSTVSEGSLLFKEHLERLSELFFILLVGGTLFVDSWSWRAVSLAMFLFLVARPVSVLIGLSMSRTSWRVRGLTGWFGVGGIGSLDYLMYAIQHGLPEDTAMDLIHLTLIVITLSIFAHGISVKPLMKRFGGH
jgi:hypothetical protein